MHGGRRRLAVGFRPAGAWERAIPPAHERRLQFICAWCGKSERDGTLLPAVGARHAWLHPNCWAAMARGAQAAIETLAAMGICALMARSVRFFAFIFFMKLRTWTFTVLSHMFNS